MLAESFAGFESFVARASFCVPPPEHQAAVRYRQVGGLCKRTRQNKIENYIQIDRVEKLKQIERISFMQKVYLIRHAESLSNIGEKCMDAYSSELSELGKKQALEIPSFFSEPIRCIVYSKMVRAKLTAEETIKQFPSSIIKPLEIQEFVYLSKDNYTNTTANERKIIKNDYWKNNNPYYKTSENSESFCDFLTRIETFIKEIALTNIFPVAVFTHKYFIKGIIWYNLSRKEKNYFNPIEFKKFCDSFQIETAEIIPSILVEDVLFLGKTLN